LMMVLMTKKKCSRAQNHENDPKKGTLKKTTKWSPDGR
jgi:hypothetical protein